MLLAVCISSYGCPWEVWRALKKLELELLHFFCALQTSRVHPYLDIHTLSMKQFLSGNNCHAPCYFQLSATSCTLGGIPEANGVGLSLYQTPTQTITPVIPIIFLIDLLLCYLSTRAQYNDLCFLMHISYKLGD